MINRIEVEYKNSVDCSIFVYTINKFFTNPQLKSIATSLSNPLTQRTGINCALSPKKFWWSIEIGFLPGVTDNVGATAREIIEDLLNVRFDQDDDVYSSKIMFILSPKKIKEVKKIADQLYNPLIQRCQIKSYDQFRKDSGMNKVVPEVLLSESPKTEYIDLNVSDGKLIEISRRRVLALTLPYMKAIQSHFLHLGRNPTDIEIESIAQTWSEHCKHTIFNSPLDGIKEGLFKRYITGATEKIRREKGKNDICVSVFKDNSGAIEFNDKYLLTHKVETHNSPSSLDPFGGAITGIVGVNRDTIGFGLGAKPIANFYGFCLADPKTDVSFYRDIGLTQKMLSSRRIMDGVIEGVNVGSNQSGIPTPLGFVYFDERYRGKPLVFVGTLGLIPKKVNGKHSHVKNAKSGDYIVMIGGRVGKDGIHGATFSSEALSSGSPVTAVQIGDPITQKKLSDAIVKEARDFGLYNSITDNGAGGLSCSVSEMAKESGGCKVYLDKVPLKYQGLAFWEIWVSESQERMTLAVPRKKWNKLKKLLASRGVEATVIGEFTNSDKCQVYYGNNLIMDLSMKFLHEGLPKIKLTSTKPAEKKRIPQILRDKNLTKQLLLMMENLNIASYEFISKQYDHIVQGNLVLGPLQGRGRVNSDAAVVRPILNSNRGIVLSYGLHPSYSDIDTYHMAASCIDAAIRNAVAAGGNPEKIALLDNFCWCDSYNPKRLWQLKRAAKACYDYAVSYGAPFISGKDSMFNDFSGFDKKGYPIKISIPPTLLISSVGIIEDVEKTVSLDVKIPGDLIYLLGITSGNIGEVNTEQNLKLYKAVYKCIQKGLIASSISVGRNGLGVALAKKAMGGMLGMKITLASTDDLFSESPGRMLVSISPANKKEFERLMNGNKFKLIGVVCRNNSFEVIRPTGKNIIKTSVDELLIHYRKTFHEKA